MRVFYVPGSSSILDVARVQSGEYVGFYGRRSLTDLRKTYPSIQVLPYEEAEAQVNQVMATKPEEVTEDDFMSALCALPPVDHMQYPDQESFKLGEPYSEGISIIYVRYAGRYWRFRDLTTLRHDQIMERLLEWLEFNK